MHTQWLICDVVKTCFIFDLWCVGGQVGLKCRGTQVANVAFLSSGPMIKLGMGCYTNHLKHLRKPSQFRSNICLFFSVFEYFLFFKKKSVLIQEFIYIIQVFLVYVFCTRFISLLQSKDLLLHSPFDNQSMITQISFLLQIDRVLYMAYSIEREIMNNMSG